MERARCAALALLLGLICGGLACAGEAEPPYDFAWKNGIYGTIAGNLTLYRMKIDVPGRQTIKLNVPSMRKPIAVRAVIQDHPAPLVIFLLGMEGKADNSSGKLWMKWYAEAGYHVITFDSTFTASFVALSGHGVTGNMIAEAMQSMSIVDAFLHLPEMQGKCTQIGVVGMSYGGIQALTVGRLVTEGKVPFKIDAIQSYSPPVNMPTTGAIIDRWHAQDRWNYTLAEMGFAILAHKPVENDDTIPFSESLMRGAISALFRMALADTIEQNDKMYKLKLLPEENTRDYAEAWTFTQFMGDLVIPYWAPRVKLANPADMLKALSLTSLLQVQPPGTEVIEAVDDPFNDPDELRAAQQLPRTCALTILPRGGHLGYIMNRWIHYKLLRLFVDRAAVTATVVSASPDAPKIKPEVPKVAEQAAALEDRLAPFAGAFRCGDKPLVEKALTVADSHPDYLFKTMGWPELVAEIAAHSGAEIQPLLLNYLARNVSRIGKDSLERMAKDLPDVNFATYLDEQRITAWLASPSGAADATKALKAAVQEKNFAGAVADLKRIEKAKKLKLMPAAVAMLDCPDADVSAAALAVIKVHADALEADVGSPMKCLIWWRLGGNQRFAEQLKSEP